MPSCGNGHAHYSMGVALPIVGTVVIGMTPDQFLAEAVPAAVKKARETGATAIFGFGWNYITFMENIPTRQQLDAICSDIPIYFALELHHFHGKYTYSPSARCHLQRYPHLLCR